MKKFFLLLALLGCVAVLGSCSKSHHSGEKLDDRLVGTKWQTEDIVRHILYGGICYEVYEFVSTSSVERYTIRNGSVYSTDGAFAYSLSWPHITIYDVDSNGESNPTDYTFTDSRTMVRDGASSSAYYAIYYRQ